MLNINTDKLKENMYIKNYKELCNILNLNITTGKSKIIQLQEISRYIDYIKDKQGFIILEIYDKPIPSHNNSKYIKFIQNILLSYLANNKDNIIYLNKNDLIKILGLVNNKYIEYKSKREELINISTDMDIFNINEFYKRCDAKICSILESSLKSLKNRLLIDYSDVYKYYILDINNNYKYYIANEEEHSYILGVKKRVLKELHLQTEYQVYLDHRIKDRYYRRINEIVEEEMGWEGVFQCYKIIYNHEYVVEALNDDKFLLNQEMKKALDTQAESRYEKYDLPANYVELQNLLSDALIKLGGE